MWSDFKLLSYSAMYLNLERNCEKKSREKSSFSLDGLKIVASCITSCITSCIPTTTRKSKSLFKRTTYIAPKVGKDFIVTTPHTNSWKKKSDKKIENSKTTYHQGYAFLSEVQTVIDSRGNTLKELFLADANDDLLQQIAKKCPNLEVLSLKPLNASPLNLINGLAFICEMKNLKKLTLNLWSDILLPTESIDQVVSQTHFQENITSLYLASPNITDATLNKIRRFIKLESLTLFSTITTSAGVFACLDSPILPATLKNLKIWQNADLSINIDDLVLEKLTEYKLIEKLSITAQCATSTEQIEKTLVVFSNLQKLSLSGITLVSPTGLLGHSQLKSLALHDWSRLTKEDIETILDGNRNLETLFISGETNIAALTKLTHLKALALIRCAKGGLLKEITENSQMQQTLQKFTFSTDNLAGVEAHHYTGLSQMQLQMLRIINAGGFNDDAMRGLVQGPLKDSLEYLQLNDVSIAHNSVSSFSSFTKLRGLMLLSRAIDEDGWKLFLQNSTICVLRNVSLESIPWNEEIIKLFGNLKQLNSIMVGNCGDAMRNENLTTLFFNTIQNNRNIDVSQVLYQGNSGGWLPNGGWSPSNQI